MQNSTDDEQQPVGQVAELIYQLLRSEPEALGRWDAEVDYVIGSDGHGERTVDVLFTAQLADSSWAQFCTWLPLGTGTPHAQAARVCELLKATDPRSEERMIAGPWPAKR